MLKPRSYNIADSNIANLGTDLEKKVREAAAHKEPAWEHAGQHVGLEIWRIEKFQVKPWPKDQYGSFYSGDSYIVLNTWKKAGNDALHWDIHFWLGEHTTQDEAGTAAYKTVELDDRLGGAPVEHREVMGYESTLFLQYFHDNIRIMSGGVETGFRHVKPEEYRPRLLHIKGKKKVRCLEVNRVAASLNSGDCFLLDLGLKILQWNGSKSGGIERNKAGSLARAMDDERGGKAEVVVLQEGEEEAIFWDNLQGGKGPVKSAEHGGADDDEHQHDKKLFRLSDASGSMKFTEIKPISRAALDSKDVFIYDVGNEVFTWVGKAASVNEKRLALDYATRYLSTHNRPPWISVYNLGRCGK
jgi:gelsolin